MKKQVYFQQDMESFGNMLRNDIAGSYVRSIFSILMILHTDFQQWSHQFAIPPTVNENSSFPASLPTFVVSYFLSLNYSDQNKALSSLISISLITKNDEYFFRHFVAIFISSSKSPFQIYSLFKSFIFWFVSSLYILNTN